MGRKWLMPAAVTGAALIVLAGCSGGEGQETVVPTIEATTVAVEVVPPVIIATAEATEPAGEEEPETVATPAVIEEPDTAGEDFRAEAWERWREAVLREDHERRLKQESILAAPVPTTTLPPEMEPIPDLTVVGVEDCLNVRALPYIEAEIVECIPLGESVHSSSPYPDEGPASLYAIEGRDGVTWRALGWPFWGFASDRYLEGPEAGEILEFPPYVAAEEFPDVAVLGQPLRRQLLPAPTDPVNVDLGQLDRIYRNSSGELVRETLVTLEDLEDLIAANSYAFGESGGMEQITFGTFAVTPDGSHVHVGVCSEITYWGARCIGTLRLFQSTDGGVTWSHLGSVSIDERGEMQIAGVLPGEDPQLVVVTTLEGSAEVRLIPSGEARFFDLFDTGIRRWQLLRDGRVASEKSRYSSSEIDRRESYLLAEDGEDLGSEIPDHLRLDHPDTSPIPSDLLRHYLPGDDPPEGWPDYISFLRHYHLESFRSVTIQHGPFLRVTGAGDCLPVLSDRSLDAEELACAAERVLLTDLGESSEVDGRTWHRVRTPSGIEGWADGRGLE